VWGLALNSGLQLEHLAAGKLLVSTLFRPTGRALSGWAHLHVSWWDTLAARLVLMELPVPSSILLEVGIWWS